MSVQFVMIALSVIQLLVQLLLSGLILLLLLLCGLPCHHIIGGLLQLCMGGGVLLIKYLQQLVHRPVLGLLRCVLVSEHVVICCLLLIRQLLLLVCGLQLLGLVKHSF